jgi:hypothetical protein
MALSQCLLHISGLQVLEPQGPGPPKSNISFMPFQDTMILKLYSITSGVFCNKSNFSPTFTDFLFSSQNWEEKKPSGHPSLSQKHEGALTTRGSSGQEPQPSSRGIYTITYKMFWSRWEEPAMNHRAPSTGTSHGGTIVELVVV